MRTIFSRGVRPTIGRGHSLSSSNPASPRRPTIIPPTRRKLTFGDAFTILLAPILTTAFLADTTAKDIKRLEWDKKIAEVQKQIEALHQREVEAWSALQLRSAQAGASYQRRAYSTAARTVTITEPEYEIEDGTNIGEAEIPLRWNPFDDILREVRQTNPSDTELAEWRRYEKYIATKVAVEMLLFLHTGRNPLDRERAAELLDPEEYPGSMDELARSLRLLNERIREIKQKRKPGCVPDPLLATEERQELDQKLWELSRACKSGDISLQTFVYSYAQNVAASPAAPTVSTYKNLIKTFSTLNYDALAYIVMAAVRNSKQILSDHTIAVMLYQYGKYKDIGKFDEFLRMLSRKENTVLRQSTPWEQVNVNGVSVIVPVTRSPMLLDILVRVAMQNDQPHKVEAWATLLLGQDYSYGRMSRVYRNVLAYCSETSDWEIGRRWIMKSIMWAAVLAKDASNILSKLIFRMLDLCVACNRRKEYDNILEAAIDADIDVVELAQTRPDHRSSRAAHIWQDWSTRVGAKRARLDLHETKTAVEKAMHLQSRLAQTNSAVKPFIGVSEPLKVKAIAEAQREKRVKRPYSFEDLDLRSPNQRAELESKESLLEEQRQKIAELEKMVKISNEERDKLQRLVDTHEQQNASLAQKQSEVPSSYEDVVHEDTRVQETYQSEQQEDQKLRTTLTGKKAASTTADVPPRRDYSIPQQITESSEPAASVRWRMTTTTKQSPLFTAAYAPSPRKFIRISDFD